MSEPTREPMIAHGYTSERLVGPDDLPDLPGKPQVAPTNSQTWERPSREDLLAEGANQARIHGVDPEYAGVYGEGWAQATRDAQARLAELEADNAQLLKQVKRANDIAKRSGEYAREVGEYRDEAWAARDLLRARIRNVREMAGDAEVAISRGCLCRCGCEPGSHCDKHDFGCWKPMGWSLDPAAVLAVLDEEGEEKPHD